MKQGNYVIIDKVDAFGKLIIQFVQDAKMNDYGKVSYQFTFDIKLAKRFRSRQEAEIFINAYYPNYDINFLQTLHITRAKELINNGK